MIRSLLIDELRFLTFRRVSPTVHERWPAYLAFGLVCTWLAGVGRYWDNPRALLWQNLGLGSLAYVFVLALVLWGLAAPLRPRNWSYRNVLLFVTLTAPPALLYAIPVEKFLSSHSAMVANAWFLAVVAAWRVALWAVFLRRTGGLSTISVTTATLLPLALIVTSLALLNLEHVVFDLMGGIREEDTSPNDLAYSVVFVLTYLSLLVTPGVAIGYLALCWTAWRRARRPKADEIKATP